MQYNNVHVSVASIGQSTSQVLEVLQNHRQLFRALINEYRLYLDCVRLIDTGSFRRKRSKATVSDVIVNITLITDQLDVTSAGLISGHRGTRQRRCDPWRR